MNNYGEQNFGIASSAKIVTKNNNINIYSVQNVVNMTQFL